MLSQALLKLLLLLGLTAALSAAAENDAVVGWLEGCRGQGFDPWQLACVTCDLMPSVKIKATCLTCCQSYKDVVLTGGGRFEKPHQAAILVLPMGMPVPEEVQKLLDDNWNELLEAKGSDRLFQMELMPNLSTPGMRFMFSAPPTYIYFFDDKKDMANYRTATSVATIANAAKESISLQSWKREDIKDMLETMLP